VPRSVSGSVTARFQPRHRRPPPTLQSRIPAVSPITNPAAAVFSATAEPLNSRPAESRISLKGLAVGGAMVPACMPIFIVNTGRGKCCGISTRVIQQCTAAVALPVHQDHCTLTIKRLVTSPPSAGGSELKTQALDCGHKRMFQALAASAFPTSTTDRRLSRKASNSQEDAQKLQDELRCHGAGRHTSADGRGRCLGLRQPSSPCGAPWPGACGGRWPLSPKAATVEAPKPLRNRFHGPMKEAGWRINRRPQPAGAGG